MENVNPQDVADYSECQCSKYPKFICLNCKAQSCELCVTETHSQHKMILIARLAKQATASATKAHALIKEATQFAEQQTSQVKELAAAIKHDLKLEDQSIAVELQKKWSDVEQSVKELTTPNTDTSVISVALSHADLLALTEKAVSDSRNACHQEITGLMQAISEKPRNEFAPSELHSVNQQAFNYYVDYVQRNLVPKQLYSIEQKMLEVDKKIAEF